MSDSGLFKIASAIDRFTLLYERHIIAFEKSLEVTTAALAVQQKAMEMLKE